MSSPQYHSQKPHLRSPELRQKLLKIAVSPHKLHTEAEIVLPKNSGGILEEQLFRSPFSRNGKGRRVLELGSGSGEFLSQWLKSHPEDDYIAFEIKRKRIWKTLRDFRKVNPDLNLHLRIVPINFNWFLEDLLPPHSFDLVIINFPDPWPKARHWKHRLVQNGFDRRIASLLREHAQIRLSTDYGPYARKILGLFRRSQYFHSFYPWPHYVREHPQDLAFSRFEKLYIGEGRRSYYFSWYIIRKIKADDFPVCGRD